MASRLAIAVLVSIIASVTVAALASLKYCFGSEMPASVIARVGPQLRSPSGGNFAAPTNALASATVLIIGAMMPSAPKSSARLATANAPSGMRTIGAAPAARIEAIATAVAAVSHRPCC